MVSFGHSCHATVSLLPLLLLLTTLFVQGSPLGRDFGEFIAAAKVNVLGLVPSIAKAWRSSGCMAHLDWRHLKCFSSTGEASSPEDYHWLASRVAGYRPVIE
jgi:acyl-coenzyme A synthetase/AMP-(fatty) acid ligase